MNACVRIVSILATGALLAACAAPRTSSSSPAAHETATAATTHATQTASAPLATASGVALHQPRPGLYTAGQPAATDWSGLAAQGVTTVINLRTQSELAARDEGSEVRAAGLRYIEIPVSGAEGVTRDNARRLHQAIGSAGGKPVLVHCASANRAGGLLGLAMVTEHGMPLEQALDFGRRAGMKSTEARVREVVAQPQK